MAVVAVGAVAAEAEAELTMIARLTMLVVAAVSMAASIQATEQCQKQTVLLHSLKSDRSTAMTKRYPSCIKRCARLSVAAV